MKHLWFRWRRHTARRRIERSELNARLICAGLLESQRGGSRWR